MNCPKCNNKVNKKMKNCNNCGFDIEQYRIEEKAKKKEIRNNKIFKFKVGIVVALLFIFDVLVIALICMNLLGKKSHGSEEYKEANNSSINQTTEEKKVETYGGVKFEFEEVELTEKTKKLDYDNDGIINDDEKNLGTNMYSKDTDNDGLTDYDEVNKYKSNPTKYSTAGDEISDYIKVIKKLDVNKKYNLKDIKTTEVVKNSYITLKADDIISEVYGTVEEFEKDSTVNSLFKVFNALKFEGTIIYKTNNKDAVLLVREGKNYTEFKNYENKNGTLDIKITSEDNYKDFVITTYDNYQKYKNESAK